MLLYGELTDQHEYVDAVEATYRRTVRTMVKRSGFISHDLGMDNRGETASPGDAAQLALWLATRHGFTEYLDDVERILRARILPSQITETPPLHVAAPGARKDADPSRRLESRRSTPPLHPASDGDGDEYRNLRDRVLGAYGGMHLEPHSGTKPTTDVTAACLHTLTDVYHHVLLRGDSGLKILLHLDYEDSRARIRSRRGERTGRLTVLPRIRENVLIRIPRWTPLSSVRLKVRGTPLDPEVYGDFALVAGNLMPAEITLEYGLPVTREVERTTGVDYHLLWRGDEVIGITPNRSFYPFYPDYPGETEAE